MATNTKRENPDLLENSELEVTRAKIKKLDANVEELQRINHGQVDHCEDQKNDIVDFLLEFMNNNGFRQIAYKILSSLDYKSFFLCRSVCRSWRDFIDNEWSMLQMQIFHLKEVECEIIEDFQWKIRKVKDYILFGPLIEIMKKNSNKSELRVFIKMCQELVSKRCNRRFKWAPEEYLIDNHRHQELKILLLHPDKTFDINTLIFHYACQHGCAICVKLLLDRSEEKEIDLNFVKKWDRSYNEQYESCLVTVHHHQFAFRKEKVDLLLRKAEEKGIEIDPKLRDIVMATS